MGGYLEDLMDDLRKIEEHCRAIGLNLTVHKSKLMSDDQSVVEIVISDFPGLKFT